MFNQAILENGERYFLKLEFGNYVFLIAAFIMTKKAKLRILRTPGIFWKFLQPNKKLYFVFINGKYFHNYIIICMAENYVSYFENHLKFLKNFTVWFQPHYLLNIWKFF